MIALNPGERILPGQVIVGEGLLLTLQTDGNFVLYRKSVPVFATMVFDPPAYVEMQVDGNLVQYNVDGVPVWATNTFGVGTGIDDALRVELWHKRRDLLGKKIKIKYQQHGSTAEAPRIPVFLGFRHEIDE